MYKSVFTVTFSATKAWVLFSCIRTIMVTAYQSRSCYVLSHLTLAQMWLLESDEQQEVFLWKFEINYGGKNGFWSNPEAEEKTDISFPCGRIWTVSPETGLCQAYSELPCASIIHLKSEDPKTSVPGRTDANSSSSHECVEISNPCDFSVPRDRSVFSWDTG